MNNKGFTLLELLVVITIVAIASVSSIIAFDRADSDSDKKELQETYTSIQRAAKIYLDMNDTWRNQFNEKRVMYLRLNEIQNQNYIGVDLIDSTTFETIPSSYSILMYINVDNTDPSNKIQKVDSCIVNVIGDKILCIANSEGKSCGCCPGYNTAGFTHNTGDNPSCTF